MTASSLAKQRKKKKKEKRKKKKENRKKKEKEKKIWRKMKRAWRKMKKRIYPWAYGQKSGLDRTRSPWQEKS